MLSCVEHVKTLYNLGTWCQFIFPFSIVSAASNRDMDSCPHKQCKIYGMTILVFYVRTIIITVSCSKFEPSAVNYYSCSVRIHSLMFLSMYSKIQEYADLDRLLIDSLNCVIMCQLSESFLDKFKLYLCFDILTHSQGTGTGFSPVIVQTLQ